MNVYWVTLAADDTVTVLKSPALGPDPAELDVCENYAGPFVTHEHARQFADDWADSLVSP